MRRTAGQRRPRGYSMLEYSLLFAIIVAALIAMQGYIQRGLAGRLRASIDSVGDQYDPRNTTSTNTFSTSGTTVTSSSLLKNQTNVCKDKTGLAWIHPFSDAQKKAKDSGRLLMIKPIAFGTDADGGW